MMLSLKTNERGEHSLVFDDGHTHASVGFTQNAESIYIALHGMMQTINHRRPDPSRALFREHHAKCPYGEQCWHETADQS